MGVFVCDEANSDTSRVLEDGNLANRTQDCNVKDSGSEDAVKKIRAVTADLYSADTHKDLLKKKKKNASPTFDRDKYENLSLDRDYELPRLKVLGRVDVEFKFTSTLCDKMTMQTMQRSVTRCATINPLSLSLSPF